MRAKCFQSLLVSVTILFFPGCPFVRPPGVSRINGSSAGNFDIGSLTTLHLESPDGELPFAVLFPEPIDSSWHLAEGHSGNVGADVTSFETVYSVRFKSVGKPRILKVEWSYSSRSRVLRVGAVEADVPSGMVPVIRYDENLHPSVEICDDIPDVIKREIRIQEESFQNSQPSIPVPGFGD